MNEVFLDTETTGLSFKEGHKIVEIACIETKDLRKKYASTVAVDGVDLQIESGQVFGFLMFLVCPTKAC